MGKNIRSTLFLISIVLLIASTTLFATQEDQGKNEEKPPQLGIQNNKEGWFKSYLVPCIPVISVIVASLGGAFINHKYWKKREETTRRNKIADQRINSYLKFCEYNLVFNACTDHIMRLEKEKNDLKEQNKEFPDTDQQAIREYENKRIDALKGLRQGISYARIFFKSERVNSSIKAYTDLYDSIRIEETKWDEEGKAFDRLLKLSKKIESSLEDELKDERKENQKRRWWQCKNTSCF